MLHAFKPRHLPRPDPNVRERTACAKSEAFECVFTSTVLLWAFRFVAIEFLLQRRYCAKYCGKGDPRRHPRVDIKATKEKKLVITQTKCQSNPLFSPPQRYSS